jgi:hypothetical protein
MHECKRSAQPDALVIPALKNFSTLQKNQILRVLFANPLFIDPDNIFVILAIERQPRIEVR